MYISILIPIFVGLSLGALVNYLSDVLPVARKFRIPACPQCGESYNLADYLLLKSCQHCGRRRSVLRNLLTTAIIISVSIYTWKMTPTPLDYSLYMTVLAYFALIAVIDIEHRLILHATSIFGAFLGLGIGLLKHGFSSTLVGGVVGFLIMLALYYLGVLFARYRAKRMQDSGQETDDEEALGFGDVNLAGVLGLLIGWERIWVVLLQGILFAGIFGVFMVLFMVVGRKYKENALMVFIPYGPFLILSAFLTIFIPSWLSIIVPK